MMASNSSLLPCTSSQWLLDSGATDHICYDISCFVNYTSVIGLKNVITIPIGNKLLIRHIGMVQLTDHILLHNVLHVPEFKYNLIYVHKLCQDMLCELHFTSDKCFVQTQRGSLMPLGNVKAGLYSFQAHLQEDSGGQPPDKTICTAASNDAKL